MNMRHFAPWIYGCLCAVIILSMGTTIPWLINQFGLLPMIIAAFAHVGGAVWAGYKCVQSLVYIVLDKED